MFFFTCRDDLTENFGKITARERKKSTSGWRASFKNSSLMKARLLHAKDPNLSREDVSSLQPLIRVFKETKGKRETHTKAKRAVKLYALFVIRSTEERGKKIACSATQAKLTYA